MNRDWLWLLYRGRQLCSQLLLHGGLGRETAQTLVLFFFFFLFALLINSACALAFPHELGAALCDTCQMLTQSNEGGSIAEASKATYLQLLLYYLRS